MSTHDHGLTCIHADAGLCPACQVAYDDNPDGYWRYGDHPAGLENLRRFEELEAGAPLQPTHWDDPSMPL